MKLSELQTLVNKLYDPKYPHRDADVVIEVTMPYTTIGGTRTIGVKNFRMGFDWDNGKFIITPNEKLTFSDNEFAKQMTEMQELVSKLLFENRHLKSQLK